LPSLLANNNCIQIYELRAKNFKESLAEDDHPSIDTVIGPSQAAVAESARVLIPRELDTLNSRHAKVAESIRSSLIGLGHRLQEEKDQEEEEKQEEDEEVSVNNDQWPSKVKVGVPIHTSDTSLCIHMCSVSFQSPRRANQLSVEHMAPFTTTHDHSCVCYYLRLYTITSAKFHLIRNSRGSRHDMLPLCQIA